MDSFTNNEYGLGLQLENNNFEIFQMALFAIMVLLTHQVSTIILFLANPHQSK